MTSGCRCSPRARLVSFREPRSLSGVKLPAGAMERNLKNVLLLSLGFLLLFTAYGGLQSLQVGVRRPRDLASGTPRLPEPQTARSVGSAQATLPSPLHRRGSTRSPRSQFSGIAQLLVSDPWTRRAGLGSVV